MSVRRLSLERFDDRAAASATGPGQQPKAPDHAPSDTAPSDTAPASRPELRPDAAEVPTGPADPAMVRLASIAARLERLAAETPQLRDAALRAAAERFSHAAAAAVPHLAAQGFAAEVAAASLAIARAGAPPRLVLRAAPAEAEEIAARLAAACAPGRASAVEVEADAALSPGEARLDWSDGGAAFDADRIAEAALACLHREIAIPPEEARET